MPVYWECPECGSRGSGFPAHWESWAAIHEHREEHADEIDAFIAGERCLCGRDYRH